LFQKAEFQAVDERFSLGSRFELSDFLASIAHSVPADHQFDMHTWIARLRNADVAASQAVMVNRMLARSAAYLVKLVEVSTSLRDTTQVRKIVGAALGLLIEADVAQGLFEEAMQELSLPKNFDSGTARWLLDAAYMLTMRDVHSSHTYVRWLQVDSSPQFGRDHLNIIVSSCRKDNLLQLFDCSTLLYLNKLTVENAQIDPDLMELHEAWSEDMKGLLEIHRCITVLLGFGFSTAPHKLETTAHAFRSESHTNAELARYVNEFWSIAPDYGIESMLVDALPVRASVFLPNWEDTTTRRQQGV